MVMKNQEVEFILADMYTFAFANPHNLNVDFKALTSFNISQDVIRTERPSTDSKYLTLILKKLRESENLKHFKFMFTLCSAYKNKISETLVQVSFGYFLCLSKLVTFSVTFDSLLNHHKALIWRLIEQNHKSLKNIALKFHNKNMKVLPNFGTPNKVKLDIFAIDGINETDLFLLSKFRLNWTSKTLKIHHIFKGKNSNAMAKYIIDYFIKGTIKFTTNIISYANNEYLEFLM